MKAYIVIYKAFGEWKERTEKADSFTDIVKKYEENFGSDLVELNIRRCL